LRERLLHITEYLVVYIEPFICDDIHNALLTIPKSVWVCILCILLILKSVLPSVHISRLQYRCTSVFRKVKGCFASVVRSNSFWQVKCILMSLRCLFIINSSVSSLTSHSYLGNRIRLIIITVCLKIIIIFYNFLIALLNSSESIVNKTSLRFIAIELFCLSYLICQGIW
jgi:hypothetical protein